MGYQRNEYYWCAIKRTVKGKQGTILCHANNIKMSHVDSNIVWIILADIDAEYGNISKLTSHEVISAIPCNANQLLLSG